MTTSRVLVLDGAGRRGDDLGLPPAFEPSLPWAAVLFASSDGPVGLEWCSFEEV